MPERFHIPDEDAEGWRQTLLDGGLTEKEIESILEHANPNLSDKARKRLVEEELQKMVEEVRRRGGDLTEKQKQDLRKGIESRFRK